MPLQSQHIFRFENTSEQFDEATKTLKEFAAHEAFRSAHVDELELDDDFHRRPVRPEDLSFINFRNPVSENTFTHLPFLTSQRLLFSINELDRVKFPPDWNEHDIRYSRFYCNENYIRGEQIRGFVENFAFSFLDTEKHEIRAIDECVDQFSNLLRSASAFWSKIVSGASWNGYIEEGTRFILIQIACLQASKRVALDRAIASGYFDLIAKDNWPQLSSQTYIDTALRDLTARCGVQKLEHSYWQFYLSTSLASCNLLYALSKRAYRALYFIGAAFVAELEWLAFGCFVGQAADKFGIVQEKNEQQIMAAIVDLQSRFKNALSQIQGLYGADGVNAAFKGFDIARNLACQAQSNLKEQLRWLSATDVYRDFAHKIDARIKAECPAIDRETFIEPREMCSTTHVHDDHRLVVIESGNMVFWGNLGMKLRLAPGEMILVPCGRLHGSSIESDECVYHQPIIPEEWLNALFAEASM